MKRDELQRRLLLIFICVCMFLAGCSTDGRQNTARSIVLIAKSDTSEFFQSVIAGATAAKSEYNVDLTIKAPRTEEDYQAQNEYIYEAIAEGAQAIIFSAISYTDNAEAIDEAIANGIKVVVIDSDVDSDGVSVRIGTDNIDAGRKVAKAVLNTDDQEIYVGIVNFDVVSRNGQERETGLRRELEKDPRVRKVYAINVNADEDEACEMTTDLLKQHPQINVIVGLNEPLSVGVARAVEQTENSNAVRVVGFDTNKKCIDLMQNGVVTALIVQNPYAMAYLGVELACSILDGQNAASSELVDTSTSIVTRENMFSAESQKLLFSFG